MCTYIYFEVNCMFFLQDIVTSVVFIVCLFAGAEANAIYSSNNADNHDDAKFICDNINTDLCDNLAAVRDAEGATAVSFSVKVMVITFTLDSHSVMYITVLCDCIRKWYNVILAAMQVSF